MSPVDGEGMTVGDLAAATGTTTRRIRSLQTLGLLPHPTLRGRTGLYGTRHLQRLQAVLHLQREGFSLESLVLLFDALQAGHTLADVLRAEPAQATGSADGGTDSADLYGFTELQPTRPAPRRGRALLAVVPTTVWDESWAS